MHDAMHKHVVNFLLAQFFHRANVNNPVMKMTHESWHVFGQKCFIHMN